MSATTGTMQHGVQTTINGELFALGDITEDTDAFGRTHRGGVTKTTDALNDIKEGKPYCNFAPLYAEF